MPGRHGATPEKKLAARLVPTTQAIPNPLSAATRQGEADFLKAKAIAALLQKLQGEILKKGTVLQANRLIKIANRVFQGAINLSINHPIAHFLKAQAIPKEGMHLPTKAGAPATNQEEVVSTKEIIVQEKIAHPIPVEAIEISKGIPVPFLKIQEKKDLQETNHQHQGAAVVHSQEMNHHRIDAAAAHSQEMNHHRIDAAAAHSQETNHHQKGAAVAHSQETNHHQKDAAVVHSQETNHHQKDAVVAHSQETNHHQKGAAVAHSQETNHLQKDAAVVHSQETNHHLKGAAVAHSQEMNHQRKGAAVAHSQKTNRHRKDAVVAHSQETNRHRKDEVLREVGLTMSGVQPTEKGHHHIAKARSVDHPTETKTTARVATAPNAPQGHNTERVEPCLTIVA